MLDILANRTYRHLFAAQVIALIGTGLAAMPCVCSEARAICVACCCAPTLQTR
jgi:hypothetical protein